MARHLLLALFLLPSLLSSQTVYVKPNGSGSGSSWNTAAGDLKAVLDNATPGTQVWIKSGTYYPTTCTNCSVAERSISFVVPTGVSVYGGFSGIETNLSQRILATASPTILSGDIDQNGLTNNNSFGVVRMANADSLTILDGLTIKDGLADDSAFGWAVYSNSGAGLYVDAVNNGLSFGPIIRHCIFSGNTAIKNGAGVYFDAANDGIVTPTLEDVHFENNFAGKGGALSINVSFDGNATINMNGCTFISNSADLDPDGEGGAIYFLTQQLGQVTGTISNCSFENNYAIKHGGAVMLSVSNHGLSTVQWDNCLLDGNNSFVGGAFFADASFVGNFSDDIANTVFSNNESSSAGGAMYIEAAFSGVSDYSLTQCDFISNISQEAGGAIENNAVQGEIIPTITGCRFLNNVAVTYGGAIYNQGKAGICSPNIRNCIIAGNTGYSCSGIYNLGSELGIASPQIINCTFYDNHAVLAAGAIYCNAGDPQTGTSSANIANCVFFGNTAAFGSVLRNVYGSPTLNNCMFDVANVDSLQSGPGSAAVFGVGLQFNANPEFINALIGDLRLDSNSGGVDNGNNGYIAGLTVDIDSTQRIYNSLVDLGAYEYTPNQELPYIVTQPTPTVTMCQGLNMELSVVASGPPSFTYQWYLNDSAINGADQSTLTINNIALNQNGLYTCQIGDGNNNNLVTSEPTEVTVLPIVEPQATIIASATEACPGDTIFLTSSVQNPGNAPTYSWTVGGIALGGSEASQVWIAGNNSTTLGLSMVSNAQCLMGSPAIAAPVQIQVSQLITPILTITADQTTIGSGSEGILFTATGSGGGNQPTYQWYLNNSPVNGAAGSTWYYNNWSDNDQVYCIMTTSLTCASADAAQSTSISILINGTDNWLTQNLIVSPNPVRAGGIVELSHYYPGQWKLANKQGIHISLHKRSELQLEIPEVLPTDVYELYLLDDRGMPIYSTLIVVLEE
jgi:predicted outer membrane repeat protein